MAADESQMRFTTRKVTVVLLIIAVLVLVLWWVRTSDRGVAHVTPGEVLRIEAVLHAMGPEDDAERPTFTTEKESTIAALLASFQTSRRTMDHRCLSVATLRIVHRTGPVDELEILPGHDSQYYEYRYNGKLYRVPRQEFVRACELIGIENLYMGR